MSERQTDKRKQMEREKALYLYANALERGDFATVETILEGATHDVDLEQMIFELHETYQDEPDETFSALIVSDARSGEEH